VAIIGNKKVHSSLCRKRASLSQRKRVATLGGRSSIMDETILTIASMAVLRMLGLSVFLNSNGEP